MNSKITIVLLLIFVSVIFSCEEKEAKPIETEITTELESWSFTMADLFDDRLRSSSLYFYNDLGQAYSASISIAFYEKPNATLIISEADPVTEESIIDLWRLSSDLVEAVNIKPIEFTIQFYESASIRDTNGLKEIHIKSSTESYLIIDPLYGPGNRDPYLKELLKTGVFKKVFYRNALKLIDHDLSTPGTQEVPLRISVEFWG
ncbi:MAG: hypothetical protein EBR30_30070 [Cytophagia bacterium]|nr:hypothetical protein [Cytophagia bacterium]